MAVILRVVMGASLVWMLSGKGKIGKHYVAAYVLVGSAILYGILFGAGWK